MNFCTNCNFKYNIVNKDNKLVLICKNCGNTDDYKDNFKIVNDYKKKIIENLNIVDLIYDPSYARTTKIKCPNKECPSRTDKKLQECILLNNNKDFKKIYICVVCKTQWGY